MPTFLCHDLVFFSQNDNTGTKMYESLEMGCNKGISLESTVGTERCLHS